MIYLTDRQKDVLELSCKGLSIPEICNELNIKTGTAKTHLNKLFRLFNVHNRVQLLLEALKEGMIQIPDIKTKNDYVVRKVSFYEEND